MTRNVVIFVILNMINHILYETYYKAENRLFSFVAFKKQHPHDKSSKIRITTQTNLPPKWEGFIKKILDETRTKLVNDFRNLKNNTTN